MPEIPYDPTTPKQWFDTPAGNTPISADELNRMEEGIAGAYSTYHQNQPLAPNYLVVPGSKLQVTLEPDMVFDDTDGTPAVMLPFGTETHCLFAFNNRAVPTYQTTTNGTTWTADTLQPSTFINLRGAAGTRIPASKQGGRWTWASGMANVTEIYAFLALNFPNQESLSQISVTVETSDNGTSWTTRHTSTAPMTIYRGGTRFFAVEPWIYDTAIRVTIMTDPAYPLDISNMKLLTRNPSFGVPVSQSPVTWDSSKNLGVAGATTFTGALNVGTNTTTQAGGIALGTDTFIHRDGANSLKTPGTFGAAVVKSSSAPSAADHLTRRDYVDTQVALKVTQAQVDAAVSTAINGLIAAAPGTLDTLSEIATALGNDPNFSATITNLINTKAADNAVVKITPDQVISGIKNFTGTLQMGGQTVVVTNDSRLTNTRTPSALSVTTGTVVDEAITIPKIGIPARTDQLMYTVYGSDTTRKVGAGEGASPMGYPFLLPVMMTGGAVYVNTADATGTVTTVTIYKNGSSIGTASITAPAVSATFTLGTPTAFAVGDKVTVGVTAIGTTPGKGCQVALSLYKVVP